MSIAKFNSWQTSSGGILSPVIQTVYATSGYTGQTIVSTTPVALTGMSVTITPKFTTSKIIITGVVAASWTYVSSLHVYRSGTTLGTSHGSNNQSGGSTSIWTHYQSSQESSRANQVFPFPVLVVDSPNSTAALTYDFRANSGWSGGTETFYFNNRDAQDMLSSSWIMVQEVKQG